VPKIADGKHRTAFVALHQLQEKQEEISPLRPHIGPRADDLHAREDPRVHAVLLEGIEDTIGGSVDDFGQGSRRGLDTQ